MNFGGLVLFCINADFCVQIVIFQHFLRSTRFKTLCTALNPKFRKILQKPFQFLSKLNFENFLSRECLVLTGKMFNFSFCKFQFYLSFSYSHPAARTGPRPGAWSRRRSPRAPPGGADRPRSWPSIQARASLDSRIHATGSFGGVRRISHAPAHQPFGASRQKSGNMTLSNRCFGANSQTNA